MGGRMDTADVVAVRGAEYIMVVLLIVAAALTAVIWVTVGAICAAGVGAVLAATAISISLSVF